MNLRLRTITLFLAFLCILLSFQSCCKVYCVKQQMIVLFIGYTFDEIDSTVFRKYERNSYFTVLIDSMYCRPAMSSSDTIPIFLEENLNNLDLSKDYELTILSTGETHRISDIWTKKFKCPCENRHGHAVGSYKLDGTKVIDDYVNIRK